MPTQPHRRLPQQAGPAKDNGSEHAEHCDTPRIDKITYRNQRTGQERQLRPARGENAHDVRHHKGQQCYDYRKRNDGKDRGIQQRKLHRLPVLCAGFHEAGQMFHHLAKLPRGFLRSDRRTVKVSEHMRILAKRLRKAAPVEH